MAWIESHQELWRHPKLKKLSRMLNISKQEAVGYLHVLWWWALDYAQDGNLIPPNTAEDIAEAVEWTGKPETFISALIESGFLDQNEYGISIHDWLDYIGKLIARRERDRARKRNSSKKNDTP